MNHDWFKQSRLIPRDLGRDQMESWRPEEVAGELFSEQSTITAPQENLPHFHKKVLGFLKIYRTGEQMECVQASLNISDFPEH